MEHPKLDQNPKFTPLSETTSIPVCTVSYGSPARELETNNLIFSAQFIGLNPVLIYEKKTYRFIKIYNQICALNSCDKRKINRQPSNELKFNRQPSKWMTPPPPIGTLEAECRTEFRFHKSDIALLSLDYLKR